MRTANNTARPRPDIGLRVMETMLAAPTSGLIALTLFPMLLVSSIEGSYPVLPIAALHNIPNDARQPGGGYNRGDYEKEYGYYRTVDRGLEARVDRRDANFHGTLAEAQMIAAALKTNEMLRAHEKRVADKTLNSSGVFTATAVAAAWTAANSVPKADVEAGKRRLRAKGCIPNRLVMDWDVLSILTQNASVQAAVYQLFPESAKDGSISVAHLEAYFKIKIVVAGMQANSKAPGEAASLSPVWDKTKVMLACVRDDGNMDAGLYDYTCCHIGNTFIFNEGQNPSDLFLAEDYPEDASRSDIIRVRGDLVAAYVQSVNEDFTPKSEVYKRCGDIITGVQA